jgi:hypothetical protein
MAEARGFSQQPNETYPALGSFTKVPTEPDVHFTLSASEYVITRYSQKRLGSTSGTLNNLVRECFYPGERFTLEPANTLEVEVGLRTVLL